MHKYYRQCYNPTWNDSCIPYYQPAKYKDQLSYAIFYNYAFGKMNMQLAVCSCTW